MQNLSSIGFRKFRKNFRPCGAQIINIGKMKRRLEFYFAHEAKYMPVPVFYRNATVFIHIRTLNN